MGYGVKIENLENDNLEINKVHQTKLLSQSTPKLDIKNVTRLSNLNAYMGLQFTFETERSI